MIILGLGSNQGDRLHHLREAYCYIKNLPEFSVLGVSPIYHSNALLTNEAEAEWDLPYLNVAIHCESSLSPEACLHKIKQIEVLLGRTQHAKRWAPRIIDIDILAWGKEVIELSYLTIPHPGLLARPFALWPLADLVPLWRFPVKGQYQGQTAARLAEQWPSRFSEQAPLGTHQIAHRIEEPALVGIINITPDSFSDGNAYLQVEQAIAQARELVAAGADILDLGAESTAPRSSSISEETEWQRMQAVLSELIKIKNNFILPPKISVDTRYPNTAHKAIAMGVDWINDVTGLLNPDMQRIVANTGVECVMMHHLTIPPSQFALLTRHLHPVVPVYEWAAKQIDLLSAAGIPPEKIIFDPGIGFGKSAEQSLLLLKNIAQFSQLGVRILVGHSRKSFMNCFTSQPVQKRDIETVAMTLYLAKKPIDYIRVHDVDGCARALKAEFALKASDTVWNDPNMTT